MMGGMRLDMYKKKGACGDERSAKQWVPQLAIRVRGLQGLGFQLLPGH